MDNRRIAHKKDFNRQKRGSKLSSDKTGTHNRSKTLLLAIFILAVAGAILISHWPILSAKALSFDDSQYLTENHLVQNPSVDDLTITLHLKTPGITFYAFSFGSSISEDVNLK